MKTVKCSSVFLFSVVLLMGLISCASFPSIESIPSNTPDDVRSTILFLIKYDDPVLRAQTAYDLGKMGSKASAAIPFLESISSDGDRVWENTGGIESRFGTSVQGISFRSRTTVGEVATEAINRIKHSR